MGTNNALKCSKGIAESLPHKITKFWLANYCWEHGIDFATEAVFKDNQRADFVVKEWKIAIEVLATEDFKKFMNKSYPLPTIPIPAEIHPEKITAMMEDLDALDGKGAEFYMKQFLKQERFK